ncbi:MAG TPA: hypothetical protein VLA24_17445 [Pseudomonadales bacterium]|nr:hypothetical protein [Pseudomonadales bacterium]
MLLASTTQAADAQRLIFAFDSESTSEGASIDAFGKDLKGADANAQGSYALTHNQADVAFCQGNWCFGVFERYDHELRYNSDTLKFYIADSNGFAIEDRLFAISLKSNELRSRGLNVAYHWHDLKQWQAMWRVNLLTSSDVSIAALSGSIDVQDSTAGGLLALDYFYSEDQLLDRPAEPVDGLGYSMDVALSYRFENNWSLSVSGQDAFSQVQWRNITGTQAVIDSNTISFNEQGIISRKPTLSGVFDKRHATQRLPSRWHVALEGYESEYLDRWEVAYQRFGEKSFVWFEPQWTWDQWRIGLPVELLEGSAGLMAEHDSGFAIQLVSDALSYSRARYLRFGMSWRVGF